MNILTLIAAAGATLCFVAYLILRFSRQIRGLSDAFIRLPSSQKAVLIVSVCIATVSAQKPGTNTVEEVCGTNGTDQVEMGGGQSNLLSCCAGPLEQGPNLLCPPPPLTSTSTVTAEDIARGYRLESVTTNAARSYEMPTDAVVRGTWHLTGAYEDVQKVTLNGFAFPLGNRLCDSLWAFTWGKVRPQLKNASNEIAAVGAPMSAIPEVSRFWTAATSDDTYLLTWENFAVGRVPATDYQLPSTNYQLLSAQLELRRNGDFITRSNEVESVYRRVIAPNPVDPDNPLVPVRPYGPVQDLSVVDEPDAYCWVDIVVHDADAWVRFEGDGHSNLADPQFAAKAGETNHVIILIGKTYKVTCDMPFSVIAKSDNAIDEWWEDGRTLWLNWPVDIWSWGDDEDMPLLMLLGAGNGSPRRHGFTMFVSPSGLGGSFNWTNSCCPVTGSGYYFTYNCGNSCTCNGCCATGYYGYEGYRLPAWGGSCGCGSPDDPDDPGDDDPEDPPVPVGVSVGFSKRVIFFEDEYANTTNQVVPWHSEVTELSCAAYGGENGGYVSFSISGADNLIQYGGEQFPISRNLQPYETFCFTNVYRAIAASGSADDIVVTGEFSENDSDWTDTSTDRATAVKVEVKPVAYAPENTCEYRHKFGVGETVQCKYEPGSASVWWVSNNQGAFTTSGADARYHCPLHSESDGFKIRGSGVEYTPSTSVVEPIAVVARDVGYMSTGVQPGQAGGIRLTMTLHATPLDVSFGGVKMEEIPDLEASKAGYFEDSYFMNEWYHGRDQYAGIWRTVTGDNQFLEDDAGFKRALPQLDARGFVSPAGTNGWVSGSLTWDVSCGWADTDVAEEDAPLGTFAAGQQQVMTIDALGNCEVHKHSKEVRRLVGGQVYLNGVLQ